MKSHLTWLLILRFCAVQSFAEEVATKCVTTFSDKVFMVKEVVEAGPDEAKRYPIVKLAETGKPTGLDWVAKEAGVLSESEKIAEIRGKEIRCYVFWKEDGNKYGDGLVCVWFGIQAKAPSGRMGFRPFLVFEGDDQIRWWDLGSSHDEKDGLTVELGFTVKGTGVITSHSLVGFKKGDPFPLRIETTGRGQEEPDVRTYR